MDAAIGRATYRAATPRERSSARRRSSPRERQARAATLKCTGPTETARPEEGIRATGARHGPGLTFKADRNLAAPARPETEPPSQSSDPRERASGRASLRAAASTG